MFIILNSSEDISSRWSLARWCFPSYRLHTTTFNFYKKSKCKSNTHYKQDENRKRCI